MTDFDDFTLKDSKMGEIRVVDPVSGGEKGAKLARYSLIPPDWFHALAEHYGRGAKKYEDRNWEKGYAWHLSEDAFFRHYAQWKLGEDNDEETGSHHLICAAWHLIALWWFQKWKKGTDDITSRRLNGKEGSNKETPWQMGRDTQEPQSNQGKGGEA